MSNTITCPHCQKLLKADKPIPIGVGLRCPDCRTHFNAPSVARSLITPQLILAVVASLILGASMIVATVIYIGRKPADPVTRLSDDKPADEKKVEDKRSTEEDTRLAVEQKKRAELEAKLAKLEGKQKLSDLLTKGKEAKAKGDLVAAEVFFNQALKLEPSDADALAGLIEVRSAMLAAKKTDENATKRQENAAQLLADGKKALADKKYAVAVRTLEQARDIDPTDKNVRETLEQARTALDSDAAEKKRVEDHRARIDAGNIAMKAENYVEAVREFQAAARLMPDDLDTKGKLRQAENKLAADGDKKKREVAVANMLDQARTSTRATRFNEAIQTLEAALKLDPDDRNVQRELSAAKTALAQAKKDNARLITQADDAAKLNNYDQAMRFVDEALRNWAEDTTADRARRTIERQGEVFRAAQLVYANAIRAGVVAFEAGRWVTAVAAFSEAKRIAPLDIDSERMLTRAQQNLEAERKSRDEYLKQMKQADASLRQQDFAAAIRGYQAALKLLPDDKAAETGLTNARYGKAMNEGQKALRERKRQDAIKGFETALEIKPGDSAARQGLAMAKNLK